MDVQHTQEKRPLADDELDDLENNNEHEESQGISVVKTLGRLNLEDNGERDWHEESKKYLDLHFPDWKELDRTVMIPPAFPVPLQDASSGDITEKKVYDLLETFGNAYQEPMFVVHSHNFAELITDKKKGIEETTKRWNKGEHDFVIIHRYYGFIFFQVKSSKFDTGEAFKKAQWQIKKDIDSMKNFLNDCFESEPPEKLEKVLYNYCGFVVVPNCQPKDPVKDGVFKNDCFSKESFKDWWDDRVVTDNNRVMSEELYQALVIRFVALRCTFPAMSSQIDETHNQIVYFHTPEQMKYLLAASAEQWWAGPAGSGKTVLLKKKVKDLARAIVEKERPNEKILVLCYNKPLSVHLEKNFQDWFFKGFRGSRSNMPVEVRTYDSFIKKILTEILMMPDIPDSFRGNKFMERQRIVEHFLLTQEQPLGSDQKYQHIFVDEGQDFLNCNNINLLQAFRHKPRGPQEGSSNSIHYFWVFFDSNQHVQLWGNESSSWESNPNVFRLTKVLRNTENVFLLAKTYYSGVNRDEITLGHREVGLNVVYDDSFGGITSGVQILVKHIRQLQQEKVKLKDIAVLTRVGNGSELAAQLMEKNPPITCKNAEYPRYESRRDADFVIIDSIRRFKGLESKVVILYDPPYRLDENPVDTSALLYTAVSRCFCYLIILSSKEGCKAIEKRVGCIKYRENVVDGRNKDWD